MYTANAQNTLIRLREELNQCSYDPRMKDYLSNLIYAAMNYPKKHQPPRHFIKNMGANRVIMVWYPMSVPFGGRNFMIPIQIYIMRNVPYEPPQFFLEIVQGSAANATNKDIDVNTNRIMTNSLRSWNQYSTIDTVMNEIYASFSKTFPIYKKSSQSSAPPPAPPVVNPGGIYGNLVGEVQNLYQQNTNSNLNYNFYNNQNKGGNIYGYQPPAKNIYGKAMSNNTNNNYNNNNYNNNNYNNNNNQPNSFGGGFYGNNNNNNNYNNNNNQQPSSFGGGFYGNNNNNNNNNQPNSFGGGIYGNNNNNNNNNQNYGGGIYNQPPPPQKDPNEEFKEILINEVSSKISDKLIAEKKRLKTQNEKLKNYKIVFAQENEKLLNFVNGQNQIRTKCDEDMTNMSHALDRVQDQINQTKNNVLTEDNCINLIEVPETAPLKIIANETSMEEMILIVRKAFEKKKISFDDTIMFMRNTTRDIFAMKFLKDKTLNKY